MDGKLRAFCVDHGSGVCYDQVPKDPAKAYRCTVTVATSGQHECRVNRLTHDVYDRCDGELRYVGRSYGDDDGDMRTWLGYLLDMGLVREES